MARKKHKRTKKAATKITLQQREVKVKSALENGHYQKAIVNLRQMLKEDDRIEWQKDARYAHHQLAEQLADTKKYRDVVSLYESGAKLCGFSLYTFEYVEALLASKQFDKAIRHYLALQDDSEKTLLHAIRTELAAYAIAGEVNIINQLPDSDPVVIDYEPALQLLKAYCSADDAQVGKQLKLISFRSPYRDLRQIIAAAIKLDVDDEITTGCEQLARIAAESAFSALADTLQLTSQKPKQLLASWASLSMHQKQFVKQVKGWGKEKDQLLKKLAGLAAEPAFAEVYRLADSFRAVNPDYFSDTAKKAAVHAIALNSRVITLKRFKQRFPQPSVIDDFHIKALVESLKFKQGVVDEFDPFWRLDEAWKLYREVLATVDYDNKGKKQNVALQQALVYRYLVEMMLKKMDDLNEDLAGYIEQSLLLDPHDKASHIQLIRYYLDNKETKQVRESVNRAVQHYPDDLAILLLAIESAIASNAFKKAANYAKTLLAVDPINREARRLLCQAHLAHSRKQIKTKKWHLVEKELKEAEQWANEPIIKAIIALQTAIMLRAQSENNDLVIELLKQAQLLMETDLNTRFLIRLETMSVSRERDAKPLHKLIKLNWVLSKVQQKIDLFSFMEQVDRCAVMYDSKVISQVLHQLSPVLKTIIKKEISLADYEKVLEFWQRYDQDRILKSYVKAAVKQYGKSPMLTYYRYVNIRSLEGRAHDEIDLAIDEAQEQGNTVVAARLISLLRMHSSPFGGFDFMDDDVFEPRKGKGSSPEGLPAPLKAIMVQLIQNSDIDDVISNMSEIMRIPEEQLIMINEIIGEDALRILLTGFLEGKSPQSLDEMIENSIVDNEKPKPKKKSKKKKGLFGFFDFFGG